MKHSLYKLCSLLGMGLMGLILFLVLGIPLIISFWSGPPC